MDSKPPRSGFATQIVFALATCAMVRRPHTCAIEPGTLVAAQTSSAQASAVELEQFLFVQAPEHDIGKGGIVLVWLPEPLQKLCLGKAANQCAKIDYCIRTTDRNISLCRNLSVNLTRIPPYPSGTRPRRMISLMLVDIRPMKGNGLALLQNFYKTTSRASLERLSINARVKARIRFIRKPDDDDFDLLQIIAVPPF